MPDGLHTYVLPPAAEMVVAAPLQMDDGEALAVMTGAGFTETLTVAVPVQPAAEMPVTVYVVVAAGLTDADPLLQTYVEAPVALSVDVCPAQIVAGVALAETVGKGFKVTVTVAVPVHPAPELPVTE